MQNSPEGAISIPVSVKYNGQDAMVVLTRSAEGIDTKGEPLQAVLEQIIQILTDNPEAEIQLPATFNPNSSESVFEWWMFLYMAGMPLFIWIISKFCPSSTKEELIARSTFMAVLVLMIIVGLIGASML